MLLKGFAFFGSPKASGGTQKTYEFSISLMILKGFAFFGFPNAGGGTLNKN